MFTHGFAAFAAEEDDDNEEAIVTDELPKEFEEGIPPTLVGAMLLNCIPSKMG